MYAELAESDSVQSKIENFLIKLIEEREKNSVLWYLIIGTLMLYPFALIIAGAGKRVSTQKIALQISCLILTVFMALRKYTVGVDTKYYCYVFEQLRDTPIWKVFSTVTYGSPGSNWVFDFEPGYRLYNKILSFISSSAQIVTIVNSCLIIGLLYVLIRRNSKDYYLSIWLYLTLGIFQTDMNVARNAISIFICYLAIDKIKEKKIWQYMVIILIASSFHKTALVFIPLYFVLKRPFFSGKKMGIAIGASIVIGFLFSKFGIYIAYMLPGKLGRYLTVSNEKMESLLVGGFYACLIVFILILMNPKERKTVFQKCPIGSWMFTLNLCCFGANIGLKAAARMAALFGPYIILFVPEIIAMIPNQKRKNWVTLLVIIGCAVQYILRMKVNNIGGTMPYAFFW